jgi:hypothetical protein
VINEVKECSEEFNYIGVLYLANSTTAVGTTWSHSTQTAGH